ncbi:unnamed protein product, partial [Prorocentrum cordatum]
MSSSTGVQERYLKAVTGFQKMSLGGVQSWAICLVITNVMEILVKGIIAPSFPTVCNFALKSCTSCATFYDINVYPVTCGITYLLCSFALVFVVAYERQFHDYLAPIEPYWKFMGVKSVVSVTYFQWFVFKWILQLEEQKMYFWHTLICCVEMPLLCIMHSNCAYPYKGKWLQGLADFDSSEGQSKSEGDEAGDGSTACGHLKPYALALVYIPLSCLVSFRAVCWVAPPEYDMLPQVPVANVTCQEASGSYVSGLNSSLHLAPPASRFAWRALPLCSTVEASCALGYAGRPELHCGFDRRYSVTGQCSQVGCGPPRQLDNAEPITDSAAKAKGWTVGTSVDYQCNEGYRGAPHAVCKDDKQWHVELKDQCQIIGCGALETYLTKLEGTHWQRMMSMDSPYNLTTSKVGDAVQFTCRPGYRGQPLVNCRSGQRQGGLWDIRDRCGAFITVLGCRCEASWVDCRDWFGRRCQRWHGCARTNGQTYTWCRVKPGSCPAAARNPFSFGNVFQIGAEPQWDTCSPDNFNISWPPEPVLDVGFRIGAADTYLMALLASSLVSFLLWRKLVAEGIGVCCKGLQAVTRAASPVGQGVRRIPGALRRRWRTLAWYLRARWRGASARLRRRRTELAEQVAGCAQGCAA